jgi:hypothetical protein
MDDQMCKIFPRVRLYDKQPKKLDKIHVDVMVWEGSGLTRWIDDENGK